VRTRLLPLLFLALALLAGLLAPAPVQADEGWVIRQFVADIRINPDGSLLVTERIDADFGLLQKHGIFREIPVAYAYDATHERLYTLAVESVRDEAGKRYQYDVSRSGSHVRIKIGDPNVTINGKHTYVITYTVKGALNPFTDHDELFWNVTGTWPVAISQGVAKVTLPSGTVQQVACFQGPRGSTETCSAAAAGPTGTFAATRSLPEGQQFTLVLAMPKGVVSEPKLNLSRRAREPEEFFDVNSLTVAGALAVAGLGVLGLVTAWWNFGRDKAFTSVYYLTQNPEQRTKPLFATQPPVLEFEPPDKLRPAEIGVLLDESADTLDCTATIIDLAVRGYLRIEEVKKDSILPFCIGNSTDWRFVRLQNSTGLAPYEQALLDGLFHRGSPIELSDLKTKMHTYLKRSQDELYDDVRERGWFSVRPDHARFAWYGIAIGLLALGAGMTWVAGSQLGAGLIFLPVALTGAVLLLIAGAMPRRTAAGSEALRRILGFREYLVTAETHRQQFNEQRNIFATYLPFAMVFGCVDKWANALSALGIEPSQATSGWYTGYHAMNMAAFSSHLSGFASQVSSTIVSTPGGSGKSGFGGGGSSGGGGGGGGGGSW